MFFAPLGFERAPDHLPIALVSTVGSGRELEGRAVGVSARAAISELQLRIYMSAEGADFERLTLEVMPFREMGDALRSGTIAAASAPDPFAAQLERDGLGRIVDRGSLSTALRPGERALIAGLAADEALARAPSRAGPAGRRCHGPRDRRPRRRSDPRRRARPAHRVLRPAARAARPAARVRPRPRARPDRPPGERGRPHRGSRQSRRRPARRGCRSHRGCGYRGANPRRVRSPRSAGRRRADHVPCGPRMRPPRRFDRTPSQPRCRAAEGRTSPRPSEAVPACGRARPDPQWRVALRRARPARQRKPQAQTGVAGRSPRGR